MPACGNLTAFAARQLEGAPSHVIDARELQKSWPDAEVIEFEYMYLGIGVALSAPIIGTPRVNRTGRCTSQIVSRYCVTK